MSAAVKYLPWITRALSFITAAHDAYRASYSENLPFWPEFLCFAAFGGVLTFGMVSM